MFEVGQKVVIKTRHGYGMVGTVLKITDKRKDVVVQFPTCKVTYNERGEWVYQDFLKANGDTGMYKIGDQVFSKATRMIKYNSSTIDVLERY